MPFSLSQMSPDARAALVCRRVGHDLERAALLRDVRAGAVPLNQVQDASPYLLSSAEVLGEVAPQPCPLCAKPMKIIHWVYGAGLGERSGTARNVNEIHSIVENSLIHCSVSAEKGDADDSPADQELAIHTVEVCPGCKWNYLLSEDILQIRESHRSQCLTNDTHELELD